MTELLAREPKGYMMNIFDEVRELSLKYKTDQEKLRHPWPPSQSETDHINELEILRLTSAIYAVEEAHREELERIHGAHASV